MPVLPVLPAEDKPVSEPLTEARRARLARDLANAVAGEVRFGFHDRMLYATDASLYQVEPIGVVIPADVEDAARAVRFCAQRGVAMLPRGGGTSLAGQCTNHAVVIDFSPSCRALLELDVAGRRARVEPGITVDDLNDQIADSGLFFAPDPATSRHANIGGCIGNNAAGARSILYGRTSENLIGVDVALADGARLRLEPGAAERDARAADLTRRVCEVVWRHRAAIRERFPRTIRRNAGYGLDMILDQLEGAPGVFESMAEAWRKAAPGGEDGGGGDGGVPRGTTSTVARAETVRVSETPLPESWRGVNLAPLLCGSEGTLAVTLGAELKLMPRPVARGLAVVAFATLDEAIAAVLPILRTGPSAVELLDDLVIDLARANAEYRRYVELMPAPPGCELRAVLYIEYSAMESAGELPGKFEALRRVLPGVAATAIQVHTDTAAMLSAWKLRKAGEPLLHGIPGDRKPITFIEDNAVPVENLERFVRELRGIIGRYGTRAAYWAHASVGVLHVRPLLNLRDEGDRERMRAMAVEVADLARSLGGVMSGEHGDGRVRGPLLERFYGPALMGAFRKIKAIFDPSNLLNPGNIVDLDGRNPRSLESMTEKLRVDAGRGSSALPGGVHEGGGTQGLKPLATVVRPSGEEVETFFDYRDQHGLDHAVEMCNGAGVCRKKLGGTMCPSYMATLDERHSTRGRGNALRLAITGQVEGLGGHRLEAGATGPTHRLEAGATGPAHRLEAGATGPAHRLEAGATGPTHRLEAGATGSTHRLEAGATGPAHRLEAGATGPAHRLEAGATGPVWDDPGTIETLHLCLSCKACKTECPSNVDIAKLKAEYTAQRYRARGAPIAARIMGRIRLLNRLGAMMPGVSNAAARIGLVRGVMNRVLGLDPRRSLPLFEVSLKRRWGRDRLEVSTITGTASASAAINSPGAGSLITGTPRVVLFGDCFTMYNEPGIGLATRHVLERLGYRVELADAGCCARAKISMGLLPEAIEEADATLERLRRVIEDEGVVAVLVVEPSCLSAFKDDWLSLKLRTPMELRRKLAAKAYLPEDFVERMWEKHPRPLQIRTGGQAASGTRELSTGGQAASGTRELSTGGQAASGTVHGQAQGGLPMPPRAILHGHCHQKALWGAESSAKLMRRVFGSGLTVLDSGCCGMAGSFGYTKDRYDLSMKIGEQVVLPAARKAAEEGVVVIAPGTSCRHQIHDGAGVSAKHPMEVVAERMG